MMHDDELPIDLDVVRSLVSEQFPEWKHEPVNRVETVGTVNAIFRIGANLAARFPLRGVDPAKAEVLLRAEAAAMAELSACCPFPTPRPVAVGRPGDGYPLPWSVQTWLPGEIATTDTLAGSTALAHDLSTMIRALRATNTQGRHFAGGGRGGHLPDHDDWMDLCFSRSEDLVDVERLRLLWAEFHELPPSGPDVMTHGDLIPANLLVEGCRLIGVLDGGTFAAADPSLDLVAGWHLLDRDARHTLRIDLGCDSLEWRRGAAWALVQAMGLIWYYQTSNPQMSALGLSTLERLLGDPHI